jgi:hypothetical protein
VIGSCPKVSMYRSATGEGFSMETPTTLLVALTQTVSRRQDLSTTIADALPYNPSISSRCRGQNRYEMRESLALNVKCSWHS